MIILKDFIPMMNHVYILFVELTLIIIIQIETWKKKIIIIKKESYPKIKVEDMII